MHHCPCRFIDLTVEASSIHQVRKTAIACVEMLLSSADVQASEARMLAPGLTVPPMDAVLKWGCTALDTHFIALAGLPPAAQQALKALQTHIQEMLQVCMLAALYILVCPQLLAGTLRTYWCLSVVHHDLSAPRDKNGLTAPVSTM